MAHQTTVSRPWLHQSHHPRVSLVGITLACLQPLYCSSVTHDILWINYVRLCGPFYKILILCFNSYLNGIYPDQWFFFFKVRLQFSISSLIPHVIDESNYNLSMFSIDKFHLSLYVYSPWAVCCTVTEGRCWVDWIGSNPTPAFRAVGSDPSWCPLRAFLCTCTGRPGLQWDFPDVVQETLLLFFFPPWRHFLSSRSEGKYSSDSNKSASGK